MSPLGRVYLLLGRPSAARLIHGVHHRRHRRHLITIHNLLLVHTINSRTSGQTDRHVCVCVSVCLFVYVVGLQLKLSAGCVAA